MESTIAKQSQATAATFDPVVTAQSAFHRKRSKILTKKPLHKTHTIIVRMEMGFGLGEVVKLTEYQVVSLDKLKRDLREQLPPDHMVDQLLALLDVENHPMLLESRKTPPHNTLVPVIFQGKPNSILFILPNLMEIFPDHEIISPTASDRRANQHFSSLTRLTFPKVSSPELL